MYTCKIDRSNLVDVKNENCSIITPHAAKVPNFLVELCSQAYSRDMFVQHAEFCVNIMPPGSSR